MIHNQQTVDVLYKSGCYTYELTALTGENCLSIESTALAKIKEVFMFDQGHGKLVHLGVCRHSDRQGQCLVFNDCWELKYSYPVFTWLHKINNYGWLVGE